MNGKGYEFHHHDGPQDRRKIHLRKRLNVSVVFTEHQHMVKAFLLANVPGMIEDVAQLLAEYTRYDLLIGDLCVTRSERFIGHYIVALVDDAFYLKWSTGNCLARVRRLYTNSAALENAIQYAPTGEAILRPLLINDDYRCERCICLREGMRSVSSETIAGIEFDEDVFKDIHLHLTTSLMLIRYAQREFEFAVCCTFRVLLCLRVMISVLAVVVRADVMFWVESTKTCPVTCRTIFVPSVQANFFVCKITKSVVDFVHILKLMGT